MGTTIALCGAVGIGEVVGRTGNAITTKSSFDDFNANFKLDPDRLGGCQKGMELKINRDSTFLQVFKNSPQPTPEFKCDDGRIIRYITQSPGIKITSYPPNLLGKLGTEFPTSYVTVEESMASVAKKGLKQLTPTKFPLQFGVTRL